MKTNLYQNFGLRGTTNVRFEKSPSIFSGVYQYYFSGPADHYESAFCSITDWGNDSHLVEDGGMGMQIVIDEGEFRIQLVKNLMPLDFRKIA